MQGQLAEMSRKWHKVVERAAEWTGEVDERRHAVIRAVLFLM